MPEASEAQKRVMEIINYTKKRHGRIEYKNEFRGRGLEKGWVSGRCTDCGTPLTPTEKLSLMPDGTTAGTYPKRPVCHHCESGYRVTKEKEGF